jgi:hypothetical protein
MPMQRKRPRNREDRFHYRFLERFDLFETSEVILVSACLILILGMQSRKGINAEEMVLAGIFTALASALSKEARKKRCTTCLSKESKPLRIADLSDDEYFYRRFRFRKDHLVYFMMLIDLYDHNTQEYQKIILDSERHSCYADTAMLIFLARMASPSSFVTMMVEFGMIECRMSIAFNKIASYLYHEWALPLSRIEIWEDYFPMFAQRMTLYGSPFNNLIGIIDGNFLRCCRPGGAGNWVSTMDQRVIYNGKEKRHGLKFLAVIFPNGFVSLFGPAPGNMHDSSLLDESGWVAYLYDVEMRTRQTFCVFGDSAFGCCRYIQTMLKGALLPGGRSFNALMSRIRIHIENVFALQSNIFHFLSHEHCLRVGTSPFHEYYVTATFLMNVRNTFYGNQFLSAIGVDRRMRLSLEEFLSMKQ